jgi:hypothetical protein
MRGLSIGIGCVVYRPNGVFPAAPNYTPRLQSVSISSLPQAQLTGFSAHGLAFENNAFISLPRPASVLRPLASLTII